MTGASPLHEAPAARVESARHALLGRVAPSLRHKMMGALHPVGLLAALAGRSATAGKTEALVDCAEKIRAQTQAATTVALSIFSWVTSEEAPWAAVDSGITAFTTLVRTDFEMRGLTVDLGTLTDTAVPSRALREVFLGGLFASTDAGSGSRIVRIEAKPAGDHAEISLKVSAGPPREELGLVPDRRITWEDLDALAAVNRCQVNRESGLTLLRIPAV